MDYEKMEGIRRSDLWYMNKTPAHFKYHMDNPEEPTASLLFGIAAHMALLEPGKFLEQYIVAPNVDRRTKAGKEEYAAFLESSDGMSIISPDDMKAIHDMQQAMLANKEAFNLLLGEHEVPFQWTDPDTGEKCKCKPDCLHVRESDGKKFIVDYKTTDSCEDGHFERSCRQYGYKFQAGMYTEGVTINTLDDYDFAFVAQEKKPPYAVRVYYCDGEFVSEGYDKFRELIGLYHKCRTENNWPGYDSAYLNAEG